MGLVLDPGKYIRALREKAAEQGVAHIVLDLKTFEDLWVNSPLWRSRKEEWTLSFPEGLRITPLVPPRQDKALYLIDGKEYINDPPRTGREEV